MPPRLRQALRQTELHVFLFFLFLILFLIPTLRGDGAERAAASYLHFFLVWALCIAVLFFIARSLGTPFSQKRARQKD